MPLRTDPNARRDLDEAADYYLARDWRLAQRLRDEYDAAVVRIAADPTSLPLHPEATGPDVRFKTIAGFPYLVLFRTSDSGETTILSVIHAAAGPGRFRRAERRG